MTQKLVYISLILLFLMTGISISFNIWLLSQKMPNEIQNTTTPSLQNDIPTETFFDSTIGTTEVEITNIDENIVTFRNIRGLTNRFKFSNSSLIIFPDGKTSTNSAQLVVGSKAILSARSVGGNPEITSLNISP